MIGEARRRMYDTRLPVEFRVGDAQSLDFDDDTFDAVRAERVFQHLVDPVQALEELARVTRPGGRIAVGPDPDWETLVIDCLDVDVLRRVKVVQSTMIASAGIARQLPAHMRRLGFEAIDVFSGTILLSHLGAVETMFALSALVQRAQSERAISDCEARSWLDDLRRRDAAGAFLLSLTGFLTTARKR